MTPEMDVAVFFLVVGSILGTIIGVAIGYAYRVAREHILLGQSYARGKADGWIECSIHSSEHHIPERVEINRSLRRIQ